MCGVLLADAVEGLLPYYHVPSTCYRVVFLGCGISACGSNSWEMWHCVSWKNFEKEERVVGSVMVFDFVGNVVCACCWPKPKHPCHCPVPFIVSVREKIRVVVM